MEKIRYTVKEIAALFSLSPVTVRNYCHASDIAPKDRFAFQAVKSGKINIDLPKFQKWLSQTWPEQIRRI